MEGHRRDHELESSLLTSEDSWGRERAPEQCGQPREEQGAGLHSRACVLTRGSGHRASWTKQGQEDTHGAQAEGSQETAWKCCSTGRGRVFSRATPTHRAARKCWDVAGRQGHSRLLGFPCDLGGDLGAWSPVPHRLSSASLPCSGHSHTSRSGTQGVAPYSLTVCPAFIQRSPSGGWDPASPSTISAWPGGFPRAWGELGRDGGTEARTRHRSL